jgi:YVTN family beta-propeller protein
MTVFCRLSCLDVRRRFASFLVVAWLALALPIMAHASPGPAPAAPGIEDLGRIPLAFVPNRGQADAAVQFQAHGGGATFFFTAQEVLLSLPLTPPSGQAGDSLASQAAFGTHRPATLGLRFEGAQASPHVAALEQLPGVVNYFLGSDPAGWRTNLPSFRAIIYLDLYPGIDLRYEGLTQPNGGSLALKGTYLVAPGSDPRQVRWRYAGAQQVHVDAASGDLVITLSAPTRSISAPLEVFERAPVAWQEVEGRRVPVSARYVLLDEGRIGFELGRYEPAYPLIIDPVLSYSTYLGGSGYDFGQDLAVDAAGSAYITGNTFSMDFPVADAYDGGCGTDGGCNGSSDVFVTKLDPTGSSVVYSTYLGGSQYDTGLSIALDAGSHAFVTGYTFSPDFPTTGEAYDRTCGTDGSCNSRYADAFVVKLSPSGSELAYATYLGGQNTDNAFGLAVTPDGSAYVTGYTHSPGLATAGAFDTGCGTDGQCDAVGGYGFSDAFVARLNTSGSALVFATYLGGSRDETGFDIALDAEGNAYLAGSTSSAGFPTTAGAYDTTCGLDGLCSGGVYPDAFVVKLNSIGSNLVYASFLGGSRSESGSGIAVDAGGNAYVTGETQSPDFPASDDAYDRSCGTGDLCYADAYVAKLSSGGNALSYATYLGGAGSDSGRAIAVDAQGNAYVTGSTFSTDYPTTPDAYDRTCGTNELCNAEADVFVTRLNQTGSDLVYSTYLGGSDADYGQSVALDRLGNVYLAGQTYSPDFPTTAGAYDTGCGSGAGCDGGKSDAFVVKIELRSCYLPLVLNGERQAPPGCAPYLVASIPVGDSARGMAVDEGRGRIYVANYISGSVSVIDADSHTVVATVPDVRYANQVAYDPTHDLIWVTNHQAGQVTPIDAEQLVPLAAVPVGAGPWGIAYDGVHDRVYVVNNQADSVTVVDAESRTVIDTLTGSFDQPFQAAADSVKGLVYITNFGDDSVVVIDGNSLASIDLGDIGQPYGVAVDETRGLAYVATVSGHRVVAIGSDPAGTPPRVLNWAAVYRGHDPSRPVPLRAIAVDPTIGPEGDGGHLWLTTTMADGGDANLALLMPKGLAGYFAWPVPYELPTSWVAGVAVDRSRHEVYFSGGTVGPVVTVLGDSPQACMIPFSAEDAFGLDVLVAP